MRESPRLRRLRTDRKALEQLAADSSILSFIATGEPTERYLVRFLGRGFWRTQGSSAVLIREQHEVEIQLGASYPRMMPELIWKSPIFHPNISASGVVCLGGYGTHWVPSLNLDELCTMLWDMIRYKNFDVESPYNREAALWARQQRDYPLPIDTRPIRDALAGEAPTERKPPITAAPQAVATQPVGADDLLIIDAEVIDDVTSEDQDIIFLD